MPAENESPAPVSTSRPQRSSTSSASSTFTISSFKGGLMALRFSGRFKVTHAILSSNSTSTFLPQGSGRSAMMLSSSGLVGAQPLHADEAVERGRVVEKSRAGAGMDDTAT